MFDLTQPWQTGRFAAFDTETTGTDPRSARIIEFGLVIFDNGEVVERFQTLIHPECALPPEITRITGIKDEDLVGKPVFAELADELERRLVAQPLLAYNADFDRGMVEGEFRRLGRSIALPVFLDPFPFCHEAFKVAKKTKTAKLVDIAAFLGIALESAHRPTMTPKRPAASCSRSPTTSRSPPPSKTSSPCRPKRPVASPSGSPGSDGARSPTTTPALARRPAPSSSVRPTFTVKRPTR